MRPKPTKLKSGIYIITCKKDRRYYVGQSRNAEKRLLGHFRHLRSKNDHHSIELQRAWDKYGEKAFEFRVIKRVPIKDLTHHERRYIAAWKRGELFNTFPPGDIDPAHISAAVKAHYEDPAAREKQSNVMKIVMNCSEVKARHRVAVKKTWSHLERRAKQSVAMKIAMNRPDVRARLSAATKIVMSRPGARARMSVAQKISRSRPEVQARTSIEWKIFNARRYDRPVGSGTTHNTPVAIGVYHHGGRFKAVHGSKTIGYFPTIRAAVRARTTYIKNLIAKLKRKSR